MDTGDFLGNALLHIPAQFATWRYLIVLYLLGGLKGRYEKAKTAYVSLCLILSIVTLWLFMMSRVTIGVFSLRDVMLIAFAISSITLTIKWGRSSVLRDPLSAPSSATQEIDDEVFYQKVLDELRSSSKREALWLKAVTHSGGDEKQAQILYIKWRVDQLKQEAASNAYASSNKSEIA